MNKLAIAIKAIQQVPHVVLYLKPAYKSYEYFLAQTNGLVRALYNGFIGGQFIDTLANLISGQLWDAYEKAWFDEGGDGVVPDYLNKSYQDAVSAQYGFVDQFYRAIIDSKIDNLSIDPLLVRAQLWANQWTASYNEAIRLIAKENGDKIEWVYSSEKEHCPECESLNGIVMYAKEWDMLGVKPQNAPNPALTCGGWQCGCSMVITKKRRSPNAYGRVEEILLSK